MLESRGIPFRYRDYTQEPLGVDEIIEILRSLDAGPRQVLRKNDKAYRELRLTGEETESALIELMARHPTLLQRPIGIVGGQAVIGRPPENLLRLV